MLNRITRDIIVVGASAGGVEALKDFVKSLPRNFKASIFIVLHIPSYIESKLPSILKNAGPLEAIHPKDGDSIEQGKIYVAPNDYHLLLGEGKILIKKGPKENNFRPSIDALFRSAAYVYKQRVIGIILSGYLNDGASGLWTIKQQGGMTLIQNPDDAEHKELPINVMEHVKPDYVVNASDMGLIISEFIKKPAPAVLKLTKEELKRLEMEITIAAGDNFFEMGNMNVAELTSFTCPECNGALVKLKESNILRYRCHTGHAFTASALLAKVSETIEGMLWQSMRGMEEMNRLLKDISEHYEHLNNPEAAGLFNSRAIEGAKRARIIHDSIFRQEQFSEDIRLGKYRKNSSAGSGNK